MTSRLRTIIAADLDSVDLRRGLIVLVGLFIAIVIVTLFGTAGMAAGLAILFVILADLPSPHRARAQGVVFVTLGGSAIAFTAVWAGTDQPWVALPLTFIVATVGTLARGYGRPAALRGLLLAIWAIIALELGGELDQAIQLTVAFAAGGLIAAAIVWLRLRALPEPPLEERAEAASRSLRELVRPPLGWYALLRATATTLAMALGIAFFPDHPTWAALTVLLVMQPDAEEYLAAGARRILGTLLGIVGAWIVLVVGGTGDPVLLAGFLATGFGIGAFGSVNYAVMVTFLTAALVFVSEYFTGAGQMAAAIRLATWLLGAAIAFATIGLGRWILARSASGGEAAVGRAAGNGDDRPGPTPGA